jgi:magnesium transporter
MTSELTLRVAERFAATRPAEAAFVLDRIDAEPTAEAMAQLAPATAASVLSRMGADMAARVLAAIPATAASAIAMACDPVRVASWLALLPAEARENLVAALPARTARDLDEAFDFPPGTAGHLMDARVSAFREETPVAQVLERVRKIDEQRVLDVLICDDEQRLTGIVSLQALIKAQPGAPVGRLARPDPPSVHAMASRDEVVEVLGRHALATLPVVDLDRRVIGVLRHDALVRAAQQAATEDVQQMVGAAKEERALSHPWATVKSRLPWLLINLLTAFAASSVVGLFDATIAQFTALAVLMPIVAGQSGNTGAQALAVTSRALALREIRIAHGARVLRKELAAAAFNGVTVGGLTATGVWIWSGSIGLAAVIGLSMVMSMMLAALSGAFVPLALTALGRDPATASSIILTTITDVTGFFSFLGLAAWFAHTFGL